MQVLIVIRQMVKPMLGLAGRVLFKANFQEGPINRHRVKDPKSRNITLVCWKLARATRVEQSTGHKAELSTLYQVYMFIN